MEVISLSQTQRTSWRVPCPETQTGIMEPRVTRGTLPEASDCVRSCDCDGEAVLQKIIRQATIYRGQGQLVQIPRLTKEHRPEGQQIRRLFENQALETDVDRTQPRDRGPLRAPLGGPEGAGADCASHVLKGHEIPQGDIGDWVIPGGDTLVDAETKQLVSWNRFVPEIEEQGPRPVQQGAGCGHGGGTIMAVREAPSVWMGGAQCACAGAVRADVHPVAPGSATHTHTGPTLGGLGTPSAPNEDDRPDWVPPVRAIARPQ